LSTTPASLSDSVELRSNVTRLVFLLAGHDHFGDRGKKVSAATSWTMQSAPRIIERRGLTDHACHVIIIMVDARLLSEKWNDMTCRSEQDPMGGTRIIPLYHTVTSTHNVQGHFSRFVSMRG
jgi:hypothetical protein